MATVRWNMDLQAVEVDTVSHGRFALSTLPTMLGTLEDAVMFANRCRGWKLPSQEQAGLIRRHLRRINRVLKEHGRQQLCRRSLIWTDEYWYLDPLQICSGVICVYMSTGRLYEFDARERHEFRLIMDLDHGAQE